ncbi:hypothetical protein COW46_01905 [Candidatus Gracilibacteria bacterium CG17_big_fil_post_rev_8_21_14_2_50_48_13]|nr:MAG: hypothetical protein COW46_01905 [Candidatus Gracilibacteria bacterium CG17_big_fil_post_rev_8_21_14_2_50_48_13]
MSHQVESVPEGKKSYSASEDAFELLNSAQSIFEAATTGNLIDLDADELQLFQRLIGVLGIVEYPCDAHCGTVVLISSADVSELKENEKVFCNKKCEKNILKKP